MKDPIKTYDLFLKYHRNEMSAEELSQFRTDLENNAALKNEFQDFTQSQQLINELRLADIKGQLDQVMSKPVASSNNFKKPLLAVGILGLITSIFFFIPENEKREISQLTTEETPTLSTIISPEENSASSENTDSTQTTNNECDAVSLFVTTSTAPTCEEEQNGRVNIDRIIGGHKPYSYVIKGKNGTQSTLTHLEAGEYQLIVKDAKGCEGTSSFVINTKVCTQPTPEISTEENTTLVATTPTNEKSKEKEAINPAPERTKLSTPKGMHFPDVCEGKVIKIAHETSASCSDNADGSLNISNISGGEAPYQIIFNDETFSDEATNNNYARYDLASDTYSIQITDAAGCAQKIEGITVAEKTCTENKVVRSMGQFWQIPSMDGYLQIVNLMSGQVVYQLEMQEGINYEWQGTDRSGVDLPSGEYFFMIKPNDGSNPVSGYVTVFN